jgi:hypothetical protein
MPVYYSILISFILSFNSYAKVKCEKLDYRYQELSGMSKGSDEFCFKGEYYFSKKCLDDSCFDKKSILLMKRKRLFDKGKFDNKVGTREFKLCHKLGGQGQILSFNRKSKDVKSARCIFNNGFVEANYLELIYLKGF